MVDDRENDTALNGSKVQRLLALRETTEQLQQQLYAIYASMEKLKLNDKDQLRISEDWIANIRKTIAPLVDETPEEVIQRLKTI